MSKNYQQMWEDQKGFLQRAIQSLEKAEDLNERQESRLMTLRIALNYMEELEFANEKYNDIEEQEG